MKRFFKNLILRNWGLKLFALLLAFLIWLAVIPEEKIFSEKNLTIPLEIHNIPRDTELVQKPPSTIDVTVKAPKRLINQIAPTNVIAQLNLEKATVDQEEYPLNNSMISVPVGAEVTKISPSKVSLKLEKAKEVMLEVVPNITGETPQGYKIEKVEVFPAQVPVRGPQSKIREKDRVRTSPIDISTLSQSTQFEADLILPRPELRLATSETKVKIFITVQEKSEERAKAEAEKKAKKIKAP